MSSVILVESLSGYAGDVVDVGFLMATHCCIGRPGRLSDHSFIQSIAIEIQQGDSVGASTGQFDIAGENHGLHLEASAECCGMREGSGVELGEASRIQSYRRLQRHFGIAGIAISKDEIHYIEMDSACLSAQDFDIAVRLYGA